MLKFETDERLRSSDGLGLLGEKGLWVLLKWVHDALLINMLSAERGWREHLGLLNDKSPGAIDRLIRLPLMIYI